MITGGRTTGTQLGMDSQRRRDSTDSSRERLHPLMPTMDAADGRGHPYPHAARDTRYYPSGATREKVKYPTIARYLDGNDQLGA